MGCGASSGQPNSPASEAAPAALDQGIGEPVAQAPDAPAPVANAPDAPAPVANAPDAPAPAANAPDAPAPAANAPDAPAPAANAPDAPAPAVAEPIPWPTHPEWLKDLPTERDELKVKADPDPAPDNWGSFPMMSAAEEAHKHVEILRELGKYGADPNRVQTESYWKPTGGKTPLLFACQKGYLDIVQALCELKADPNQTTDDGVSCLMYAANNGQLEAMRMLCGFGSNPNQTMDSGGAGALLLMATEGQTEAVRVLLELKADPNQAKTNGHTPILCARHFATQGKPGCQEVVTLLEAAGA